MKIELDNIYQGDCLELMRHVSDKSIDMILCDLPYGTTACKWDTIIPFEPLWEQYKRIIKDNGAIVLTASQPFTSALVMSNVKMFKTELIWEKEQGTNQFLVKYHPLKKHENILLFGKKTVKYNPQMESVKRKVLTRDKNGGFDKITGIKLKETKYDNKGFKYPTSIIKVNRELRGRFHPTQKPVALFEYLIKTYTNKGDIVLDNCAGSFTTAIAAENLKRNWMCIEKEREYCEIGLKRIVENRERLLNIDKQSKLDI